MTESSSVCLYYEGYSPAMRDIFPSNLFRAELLKVIKYPEVSYRKFCTEEYFGLDRKQNRVFMGLSLNKKGIIDHTQLCKFRSSLSFVQQVNLLVYILHHFFQSGLLSDNVLHGIDSTELACDCQRPMVSLSIKGKKTLFTSAIEMINQLIAAQENHTLLTKLKTYQTPDVLVCDEIGYLPLGQQGSNLFFQVISARHEQKSAIITTNLPFAQWGNIFDSTTVATAIADRLVYNSEVLVMVGKSYRKRP